MAKQMKHAAVHVARRPGGDRSGPAMHHGAGFGGTGCIPYCGYGADGTTVRLGGGNMQAWRRERQKPTGGPVQTERRQVKRKK